MAPKNIVAPKHTNMTVTPHMANANPPNLQICSTLSNSVAPLIGLINKYPNNPGNINEIEVDPVDPTNANTCSNDVTVIATRYDKTRIDVVIM